MVEAVCEEDYERLLNKFTLDQVSVRVRKTHAPNIASRDTVEIEMMRKREEV